MQFSFTSEQEEFRSVLRRFLEEKSPPIVVRRLMETEAGWDRESWRELNQQLGLTAVHIPEAYGGQGFGFVELGIVLEEMGRALLCAPYFASTVLAATAIMNAGSEAQKRALLPGIAAGDTIATLAFTEPNGRWDAAGIETTATAAAGGFRLDGVKSFVLDGHTADMIVVVARPAATGLSFFTVPGDAPGLTRRALKVMDPTRKQARLEFRGVAAELLGEEGGGAAPFARTMMQAAVCLANEMVGGAEKLRQSALDYANLRVQFGRAIGIVPVDEAQAGGHAGRCGAGEVGRVCRCVGCGRGRCRTAGAGIAGEGLRVGGVYADGDTHDPDPRRHRVHLGQRHPSVVQAGEELRGVPGRSDVSPRADDARVGV